MGQHAGSKEQPEWQSRVRSARGARDTRLLRAETFGASKRGEAEVENQDRFLTATLGRWAHVEHSNSSGGRSALHDVLTSGQSHVMMVADGMGGPGHGALASQLVIETLYAHLATRSNWAADPAANADSVLEDLRHAIGHAHHELVTEASRKGMGAAQVGTTIIAGIIAWPLLLLAHAGDSRCYLFRAGSLRCLTRDHTLGQDVREQDASNATPLEQPLDHILTSALLNSGHAPRIDLNQVDLREGDAILMCTDGLSRTLSEQRITRLLAVDMTAQAMCETLLAAAGRTDDNATVVATKILRG